MLMEHHRMPIIIIITITIAIQATFWPTSSIRVDLIKGGNTNQRHNAVHHIQRVGRFDNASPETPNRPIQSHIAWRYGIEWKMEVLMDRNYMALLAVQ